MNVTRFLIKGRAHGPKLNNLIRQGFKPRDIKSENKLLEFNLPSRSEKAAIAFLDELCYDYEIKGRAGIKHTVLNLLGNKGLFLGVIISIILLIVCSLFVFQIDIIGTERIDINTVQEAVNISGVRKYGLIYSIDKKLLISNVLAIEGISSATVETKGVKVYVYVQEELPKPQINDYSKPIPIKSEYDAVITRVVVLSGTALVKKGDTVLKGRTLIAPYISNSKGEDEEKIEIRIPLRATGMVYGKVWHKESTVLKNKQIVRKRTGNYIETATPRYIFPSKNNTEIPYELYESEEKIIVYNAFFPLTVTYTRYYELEEIEIETDTKTEVRNIISKSYLNIREKLPSDAVVVRHWSIIKELDNSTIIDVYLETEQRIDNGGEFGENFNQDNKQS